MIKRLGYVSVVLLSLVVAASAWASASEGNAAFARGDYRQALAEWQPAAEAGDARAQFGIGLLYANGRGVARDPLAAQRWYGLAAERGMPAAQYNLAVMRETGDGIPRDVAQAGYWYTEAATAGSAAAANNLALMILGGDGLDRRPERAVKLMRQAGDDNRQRLIDALPVAKPVTGANLRAAPGIAANRVGSVSARQALPVFAQRDGWAQVWNTRNDRVGWVSGRLLRGLPDENAEPVALAALAGGSIDDPVDARNPGLRGGSTRSATVTTTRATTRSGAPSASGVSTGNARLVRNSGWLINLNELSADAPAEPAEQAIANASSGMRGMAGERRRVATRRLNVRAWPSERGDIVGQLKHNDIVRVVESRGGWRRIALAGEGEGWVAAFLLGDPEDNVVVAAPVRSVRSAPAADLPKARPASAARTPRVGQGGG